MSDSNPTRRQQRAAIALRVRVKLESWTRAESFLTANVSRGGMFLATPDAVPRGTRLMLAIELPDGTDIDLLGQVQHAMSRERAQAEGRRPGLGVRFLALDDERREKIERMFATARSLAKGSEAIPAPLHVVVEASGDAELSAIRGYLGELKALDYFSALGVSAGASGEEIDASLRTSLERWDPARFTGKRAELREVIAEIVILLQNAHAALSDPGYRTGLEKRLRGPEPATAELGHLFDDVDRDTTPAPLIEPDGSAATNPSGLPPALVEARLASRAGDHALATAVLVAALAESPDDRVLRQEYHLAAGRSALRDGETDAAARNFDEVLSINPDNAQAIAEMRRLTREPQREKRALLRRLFRRDDS